MSGPYNLFRSVRVISVCTFLSRVLGLVRDMICASIFGTSMVWDAFTVAFKIPNLFRRLFGEGALSAAFIPIFTEQIEKHGKAEAWKFANIIATLLIIILGGIVLLGEVSFFAIPKIFQIQEKWQLIYKLLIVMFPYVLFICLVAFIGSVLNTIHHFFMPAFAPVVMNVCWILGAVLSPYTGNTLEKMIYAVAVSTFLSGLVQIFIHIPVLRQNKLYYRFIPQFSHPGLKLVLTRMAPIVFGLAVVQINVLLDSVIAVGFAAPQDGPAYFNFAGMSIHFPLKIGAASVLYYSDRLIQFPLGVFGIAMATAVFPLFSTHAVREDWNNFSTTFNKALKFILFIGIPASLGIIMLREPIIDLLYRRNQFDAESAYRTSRVVFFYAIGIWAYCGLHVLIRAFYSVKDTVTPVKVGAMCVGLNLILNLSLIWVLQEGGLALSTAVSAIVQIIILTTILQKRLRIKIENEVIISLQKTVVASIAMAFTCWFILKLFPDLNGSGSLYFKGIRLFVPMLSACAAFSVTSFLLKSEEFGEMVRLSLRKI
ncbi:MAG: murein biosynthesis integral membrane protein MurJ [Candidatus Jettenia sp.]|nr:murein biosynthesis integral membrane protein MurJ [Candidatus Jettenia sp. AMX1]MBC6929695.1 murein biosynthesis integral membrane protein MurJ [Candidatus Jettenia sp.]KAA0248948.1 MAG: murein biosynthesis integral membrane protein MurJ [Candidatus Jettenia sp. AMX1]MCE7881257.1 murein biosynthesis integral membrane protein MurJ [Candidatus Jettenia sp. AMX1]MCQ3928098.1 murein biosynthesis integral membrane protein MurJ [Candidatus Jettenia sp.]MDL1939608.1 murein biosynthesis integral m